MKRIRNDLRVLLIPNNAWGREKGETVGGMARFVVGEETGRAGRVLREKYWLGIRLSHLCIPPRFTYSSPVKGVGVMV